MFTRARQTPLKGAIVGIGGYGQTHLRCLRKLAWEGGIEIVAAVHTGARHEEETARSLVEEGCRLFLDVDEMLNEMGGQLDFCTLPTSIGSHIPLALRCIERKIHCLVEKPLTGDAGQLEQLERAMEQCPEVVVTVGYQMLFLPEIMEARKRISDGYIGRLKNIRVFGAWPRPASYYTRNDWAGRVRTPDYTIFDSPLNNAMAHYLNLGLYWAGGASDTPLHVQSVEGSIYRLHEIENFDTASCRFHLDNGVPVSAWVTHSCREQIDISILVEGEQGCLRWQPNKTLEWELDGKTMHVEPTSREVGSMIEYRAFLDAVGGNVLPECRNVPQAALHVRAILALQDTLSVQDVSPGIVERIERDGEIYPVINGVEKLLLDGFRSNTLVKLPTD